MRIRLKGAAIVAATMVAISGCSPAGEPWDSTGYFEKERARSTELQKQLRDRVKHTQIGADRPAHYTRGS